MPLNLFFSRRMPFYASTFSFIALTSIAFLFVSRAMAATISGQVMDENKSPVSNTKIIIPAIQKGTVTDASGNFKLENIPAGKYAVEFRSPGFATQSESIPSAKETRLPSTSC